jgi:hypothetical protein
MMAINPEPDLRITYTPYASEHDLIYGYVYGCFLIGHGAEPWLVRRLSTWTEIAEAELERLGLLKKAKRIHRILLKQHHQDNPEKDRVEFALLDLEVPNERRS